MNLLRHPSGRLVFSGALLAALTLPAASPGSQFPQRGERGRDQTLEEAMRVPQGEETQLFGATVSRVRVDVIVTDVETGMDEIELLDTVHELQPKILRIVLSDESERDKLLCSTAPVHQIIPKPFNPETLKTALERTVAVFDVINNEDLKSRISKIKLLPSPPQLYLDLNRELRSTDVTMTKLGELIATDVALTAKIL